jgi:hypothetical protein
MANSKSSKSTADIIESIKSGKSAAKPTILSRIMGILFISMYIAILYYLVNLEECDCLPDWRFRYLKVFTVVIILFPILVALLMMVLITIPFVRTHFIKFAVVLATGYLICIGVYWYSFYTYITDINEMKCKCAVEDQPKLNELMKIIRIVGVIMMIFIAFAVAASIFIGLFIKQQIFK